MIKTISDDKKPVELKGKYFFVILNKQYFRKKTNPNQQTPEKQKSIEETDFNKLTVSERITLTKSTTPPQKNSEEKKQLNIATSANLSRALSPGGSGSNINNSINSAGKIKTQNSQAKVNTGSPKKKIKASPIILDTIVNEVVNKHTEDRQSKYEEDINKINECVYLTKVCNEGEEEKKPETVNESFGEKQEQ